MSTLDHFLETCRTEPSATCKLSDFLRAFRAFAGPQEAQRWPRYRVIAALAQRFPLGTVDNGLRVGGLALPASGWQSKDGALVLV